MIKYFKIDDYGFTELDSWQKGCWVNVVKPTADEKKFLIEKFSLPEAFYNDIADPEERPRLELEDDWIFIVLRIPIKTQNEDLPYYTVPLGFVVKEDMFFTICFFDTHVVDDFIRYSSIKKVHINNFYDLTLRLFVSSSVWFSKYLKQINRTITITEDSLDQKINNYELEKLFNLEKSLIYFTTTLTDHTFLFRRLNTLRVFKENTGEDLREDVEIELMQAQTTTRIYYDILRRMEDSYDSRISNNMNIVMKHLTSISIILMIPTLVASFYGMNVQNYWEHNPFAFFGLIIGSFFLSFVAFLFFKKIDWF